MIQRSVGNSLTAIAGFWFVGSLHLRLTARGPSTAAWAAFGGGVAMVTLLLDIRLREEPAVHLRFPACIR
jgi:hypothetical protein